MNILRVFDWIITFERSNCYNSQSNGQHVSFHWYVARMPERVFPLRSARGRLFSTLPGLHQFNGGCITFERMYDLRHA